MFAAITLAIRKPRGVLAVAICEESPKWAWRCAEAGSLVVLDNAAIPKLKEWGAEARERAVARRRKSAADAAAKWRHWVDEQLAKGAGALHRFTKRQGLNADEAVATVNGPSLKISDVLSSDRAVWAPIWGKFDGSARAPWRTDFDPNASWVATLPRLTAGDLKAASSKFKRRTGLGCDSVHPRTIGWLSDNLLNALADFFVVLENKGIWPSAVRTILMAQIPKACGGKRPVGLLSGFVRVWEKARQPVVSQWRQKVSRDYNWAAKGRSPQAAVWKQAIMAEAAVARGQTSAATLLDLVKAFEMVRLELIWARGIELGFPALILRMVLETFAFTRRLFLHGAVADAVDTLSAILAGGGFATDAMPIVLIKPCDTLTRELSDPDLCLFVDDLTIHVVGNENCVNRDDLCGGPMHRAAGR